MMDRPKAGGGGKGQKMSLNASVSRARIVRLDTDPRRLDTLLEKCNDWKFDVRQWLGNVEAMRTLETNRRKIFANLDPSIRPDIKVKVTDIFCCKKTCLDLFLVGVVQ